MKVGELKRVIEHLDDDYEVRFQLDEDCALNFAKSILYGNMVDLPYMGCMEEIEYREELTMPFFRIILEPCDWDIHERNWTEFDNAFEIKEVDNK